MIYKLLFSLLSFHLITCNEIQINTTSGVVKGLQINVLNKSIDQFLGIPYAEPPVGSLRFSKPKPITKPIEGIIDATKGKNSCIQPMSSEMKEQLSYNLTLSEDCLTLNIWSPKRTDSNSTKLKPVMFWIYGGGLSSGSIFIPAFNGRVLATHDIVFVSVNYRVGPLGFLYGGEESAPGNVGFHDQLLGLKWVRENIHLFGGDKNQITIFGESAGSWSVSAQIVSPLSKGLYKRAIMESGSIMFNKDRPVLSKEEAILKAKQLAKHVNCTDDNQWLQCLRTVDAKLILPIDKLLTFPVEGTDFLPVSVGKSFTDHSYNRDIDLLAGVTSNEGSDLAYIVFPSMKENNKFNVEQFEEQVNYTNSIFHNINTENVVKFYLGNVDKKNSLALKKAFFDFFGDILIKCSTYRFAKRFAEKTTKRKTYFYEWTYQGSYATAMGCDEETMGICHGADVPFVFGLSLLYQSQSSELDIGFTNDVMKMWTNFAKTGDPGQKWPQIHHHNSTLVKIMDPRYLNAVFIDPFERDCDGFWKNYF